MDHGFCCLPGLGWDDGMVKWSNPEEEMMSSIISSGVLKTDDDDCGVSVYLSPPEYM